MSRANSAPVITFSIPSVQVTPIPVRGSLSRTSTDTGQSTLQTLALPRPPRCLTPYPDTSKFSHSLEPSPLSSPAFSAYSMASSTGDTSFNTDANTEDEGDNDVDDLDLVVEVDSNVKQDERITSPKDSMSPGAKARADNAKLLAPALYMSHMNSPTDRKPREMPLSPMRRLQLESVESSGMTSPVYSGPTPILHHSNRPALSISCSRQPSSKEVVGVWLDRQRVDEYQVHQKICGDEEGIVHQEYAHTPDQSRGEEIRGGEVEGVVPLPLHQAQSGQVLEVHVETVD